MDVEFTYITQMYKNQSSQSSATLSLGMGSNVSRSWSCAAHWPADKRSNERRGAVNFFLIGKFNSISKSGEM